MKAELLVLATTASLLPTVASAHPGHVLPHGSDTLATAMLGAFALLVAARMVKALPDAIRVVARRR